MGKLKAKLNGLLAKLAPVLAFLKGPDFVCIHKGESEACQKGAPQESATAVDAATDNTPVVEVQLRGAHIDKTAAALDHSSADDERTDNVHDVAEGKPAAGSGLVPAAGSEELDSALAAHKFWNTNRIVPFDVASAGLRCKSALGTRMADRSISDFNKRKQVYSKEELSPLPFQPPAFWSYLLSALSGSFKVFQYVVTVLVALMVTHNAVQRYWQIEHELTFLQGLLMMMFIAYPMITLMLMVCINNEIAVRRFMYYRLMSLQVLVDWENTPLYKLWFLHYFWITMALINLYGYYAGRLTNADKTTSTWPQMSVMNMQSLLLIMFWYNIINMEEGLVSLNKFIENSPTTAKELITNCDVVSESQLKAAIRKVYRRMKAFDKLTDSEREAAKQQLNSATHTGDSKAAFFDLLGLRQDNKSRLTKEEVAALDEASQDPNCCSCTEAVLQYIADITFARLYAWKFCSLFLALALAEKRLALQHRLPGNSLTNRSHSSGNARGSFWPYRGDTGYFAAFAVINFLCVFSVVALEAYALWFVIDGADINNRKTFGVLECRQCYDYHASAGAACQAKPASDSCWAAANLGFCAMQENLYTSYGMGATQMSALDANAGCAKYLNKWHQ